MVQLELVGKSFLPMESVDIRRRYPVPPLSLKDTIVGVSEPYMVDPSSQWVVELSYKLNYKVDFYIYSLLISL